MILFLDDEPRYSLNYVEELKQHYAVEYKSSVDDALEYLEAHRGDVRLLVLDVMMPPDNAFSEEETRDGIDTGKRLLERLREGSPELPVIVLTNVAEKKVVDWFVGQPNCSFYRKRDYLPRQLKQKVDEILSK
jgi:CheY-like chemotaxis protein